MHLFFLLGVYCEGGRGLPIKKRMKSGFFKHVKSYNKRTP